MITGGGDVGVGGNSGCQKGRTAIYQAETTSVQVSTLRKKADGRRADVEFVSNFCNVGRTSRSGQGVEFARFLAPVCTSLQELAANCSENLLRPPKYLNSQGVFPAAESNMAVKVK